MKTKFIIAICIFFVQISFAQENRYISLKSEGTPPEYFRVNAKDKTKNTEIVTSPYRPRNERIAEIEFYKSSHYWVNDLLASGKVIYGEKIHEYLTKLMNHIAKSNGIEEEIFVHPVKYGYFNAFATDVGLIFVNIGLFAKVRNEAELAFILSHELAHYYKKHNLEGHLNQYKLENLKEYSKLSSYDKVVSKHSYSRRLETEADSLGYIFYTKAGYSLEAAASVFDIMINDQDFHDGVELNSIIDFSSINSELPSKIVDSLNRYIIADTIEQEELSTHPDSRKRKKMIEGFNSANENKEGKLYVISESDFAAVKSIAILEECRLSSIENSFFDSFYFGLYNYQKNGAFKEYSAITVLRSLIGLLQYKVFDPINNPRYKNYGGLSNANLNKDSDFRDMAFYYAMKDYQTLVDDITKVFEKFNGEFPDSEQLKVLQNWFIDFVEKEIKPTKPETKITLSRVTIKSINTADKKKIYIDPSFLSLDFRKVYMLDYKRTEKENLKVIDNMKKYNKMSDRYNIYTVADKSELMEKDLNAMDLISSRMEEIETYPKEAKVFPTDYYELKELCETNNTSILASSSAVTAYVKRMKPIGTILCFYSIVLSPLGIYLMVTPDQYTFIDYHELNLMSGEILVEKEAEKETKLSGSILRDLYFPRK